MVDFGLFCRGRRLITQPRDWLDVAVIKLEDVETPFGIVRRVLQLLL
jgi:hypothetical protein